MTDGSSSGLDNCPVCGKPLEGESGVCECKGREEISGFEELIADARKDLGAARSALARGEYEDVELFATRAAEKYGETFQESLELRAFAAVKAADFARAAGLIDAIEESEKRDALTKELVDAKSKDKAAKERFNLALTAARDGKHKEAEVQLIEAISLAPYLPEPYRLLVKIYAEMNLMDDARHYFRELEHRFPGDPSHYEIGRLLSEISDFEKEESKFKYNPGTFGLLLAGAQIALLIVIIVILLTR